MRIEGLADTGALLALLDADDHWHERCRAVFSELPIPLAVTAGVLAELFHLVMRRRVEVAAVWRLVMSEAFVVLPIVGEDMPSIAQLMERYADRPMDFTDATLVHVAERESTDLIFTIDHNDFETYRVHGRPFRIEPLRAPLP